MSLVVRTPFGRPVAWADVSLVSDIGDGCCVVISRRRLGYTTTNPLDDFLLCLVALGTTGRAARLAQAAFVESFLANDEVDVLWRLQDAIKTADARLANLEQGRLSTSMTAVFLAGDGTAYGVSVGDLPLVELPPGPEARSTVLGRETSTTLGAGEGIFEQWWPDMNGDGTRMRLAPGSCLELGGRGVGHAMVSVRFHAGQVSASLLVTRAGSLVSVVGQQGGSAPDATWAFALACLAEDAEQATVSGLVRGVLELDRGAMSPNGLESSFTAAGGDVHSTRLAMVVATGPQASVATLASGGASADPTLAHSPPGEERPDAFTLRLGPGADPLDRGTPVEFQRRTAPTSAGPRQAKASGTGRRRLAVLIGRLVVRCRMWRPLLH
jgi:hypothetical protein